MKLQLFADEAGAAENENTVSTAETDITVSEEETVADRVGEENTPLSVDGQTEAAAPDGALSVITPDEMTRICKIAEGLARSRLEKEVGEACEREIAAVTADYPNFRLENEMSNPVFRRLALMGVPLKNAFEAANFDRLLVSAMRYAAKKTAEKTAAAPVRIGENPVLDRAPAVRHTDVNSLTEREIRRVIEAAGRGEKITFR